MKQIFLHFSLFRSYSFQSLSFPVFYFQSFACLLSYFPDCSLYFFAHFFLCYYHFYSPILLLYFPLLFFVCSTFHFFCLPFYFSYFYLSFTLFNYLVPILDFNYCMFSLLLILFSINLCYLFPFSLAAFFTKCEFLSFFSFQHMLGSVFWFYT